MMNMKVIIILFCLGMIAACQSQQSGYVLKGELQGAPEGDWVFLTNTDHNVFYDSVQLKNGQFEFRGVVESPELRGVTYFKDPAQRVYGWKDILTVPVYMENTEILFSVPFTDMPSKIDKGVPGSLRVEGSKTHDLYADYKKTEIPLLVKDDSLFDAYRELYYYNAGTEEDVFCCVREMDATRDVIFQTGVEFIRRHADSPVALHVAQQLKVRSYSREKAQEVADLIPVDMKMTPAGKATMTALLECPLYVGDVLPDFDVLTTDLKTIKLSELLKRGHYTLVELWASWCGPCRGDIPHLKETYKRYHAEGFDIVSISIDDDTQAWLKAVKEENMEWSQVCGANGKGYDKECMLLFGTSGVPACVLVDGEGKVLSTNARGGWLNEKLASIYKK